MALQTSVKTQLAVGVVGDFYDESPRRVDPYTIKSATAGSIGLAYTIDATDPSKVVLGGSGVFGGIAVNSKEFAVNGLGASMNFKQYDEVELCTMGRIWLSIAGDVAVGKVACFDPDTGIISPADAGADHTEDGLVEIKGSKFILVKGSSTEPMVVLQLG